MRTLITLLLYYFIILLYSATCLYAQENPDIVSLTKGTSQQLEVVVESSDKKPVVKLLQPDYEELCRKMIPDDYFSSEYTGELRPDIHSLITDTPAELHSQRIPIVWNEPEDAFYYGRFLINCSTDTEKWEIKVINSRGKKIINYKGTGTPPKSVELKEEDISEFNVGEPYSPVLSVTAKNGKEYSFYGDVFSLDLLVKERKKEGIHIELNSKTLFDNDNNLTEKGRHIILGLDSYLIEIKNPSVEIKTRTAEERISGIRTSGIVDMLNREFFIPVKNIRADLYIYSKIDYPSIEIIVKPSL
ncbi:MAG: hypothetical protein JW983_04815 [Elusimicrobia bacterium]|nr:hypothetical protein [Elusimicrobiota bacterium]